MKRWPKGTWMRLQSPDTLRALMAQRNFSMERLARYSGCSKSFISHLTSGRKTTCTDALGERIAEALEVPLEILFIPSISTSDRDSVGGMKKAV
jgi:transcriptional regulator with XRE-family HTH domain